MIIKSKYIMIFASCVTLITYIVGHVITVNYIKAEWGIHQLPISTDINTVAQLPSSTDINTVAQLPSSTDINTVAQLPSSTDINTVAQLNRHSGIVFYNDELCVVKLNQHNTLNISKFIESQIVNGYTMRTECQFIENIDTINIIAKYCILLSTFCMFTTIMIILLLWIKVETKKVVYAIK